MKKQITAVMGVALMLSAGMTAHASGDKPETVTTFEAAEELLRRIADGKVSDRLLVEKDELGNILDTKVERYEREDDIYRFCNQHSWDIRSLRLFNTMYLVESMREISMEPEVFSRMFNTTRRCFSDDSGNDEAVQPGTKQVTYLTVNSTRRLKPFYIPGWREKYQYTSTHPSEFLRVEKAKDAILEKFPDSMVLDGEIEAKEVKRNLIADKTLIKEYDDAIAAWKKRAWVIECQPRLEEAVRPGRFHGAVLFYLRRHPRDTAYEKDIQVLGGVTATELVNIKSRLPKDPTQDFFLARIKHESRLFDEALKKAVYACRSDQSPDEAMKAIRDAMRLGGMSLEYPPDTPGAKAYRRFKLGMWLRLAHLIETKRSHAFDPAKKPSDAGEMNAYRAKLQWHELASGVHDQVELFINGEYDGESKEDRAEVVRDIEEHIKSKEQADALKKDLFSPDYRPDILLPGFSWPTVEQLLKIKP